MFWYYWAGYTIITYPQQLGVILTSALKVFNIQPIEKAVESDGKVLDVHTVFSTIQGEGPFAGQPAVFVRLAGCNLQCPLCDTEYTHGRMQLSIPMLYDTILDVISGYRPLIVITGGEPLRQNIAPFVSFMLMKGYRVQIETNGSLYRELPFGNPDLTIVCSPKSGKLNEQLIRHVKAFKYVGKSGDLDVTDGLPIHALDHPVGKRVARPPVGFPRQATYLQPVDTQDEAENKIHLQAVMSSVRNFGYTLCLQTHKIINVP